MNDRDSPAFVGRRQTQFICNASTRLEFNPRGDNEEAGLVVRGNENNHYEIGITQRQGVRRVFLRKVLDGKTVSAIDQEVAGSGAVVLSVQASPSFYEFFYKAATGISKSMGKALTIDLSSERIGGFTGVYIGMYATGNGQKNKNPADFDWFEYNPKEIQ
jgi:alpha-N-arabinofuranosidase